MRQRIIIMDINKPKIERPKEEIKWIFESLGFKSGRDIEDTSFKILNEMIGQFRKHDVIATDEISKSLSIEAPTVNHHIRNLMESGFVLREKRKVVLRGGSLSNAIEEMKRDSDKMFERIMEVAKKIDDEFGLD